MAISILERAGRRIGPAGTADAARGRRLLVTLAIGLVAAVNLLLVAYWLTQLDGIPVDWAIFARASDVIWAGGDPYTMEGWGYRYAPLLTYAMAVVGWVGPLAWRLLHIVGALALPTWPMRLLALVSWPFWVDVREGNLVIFVVLAAAWALRGSRAGTLAFLALAVLVPRPIMLPVLAWLLWKRPDTRWPFLGMAAVSVGFALLTGHLGPWLSSALAAGNEMYFIWNVGPSRLVGAAWIPIGLALAAWLTWKGRVGLASLAASPYLLPYYLLFGLLDAKGVVVADLRAREGR